MEPRQVFRSYRMEESRPMGETTPRTDPAQAPPQCPMCGFTAYRNPYPGVIVLVEKAGNVLLCKRSPASFQPDAWCLPGGFIEYDEDFLSAGIREVREETGLSVSIESILSVVSNFLTPKMHSLVIVLLGRAIGGREMAGDDAVSLQWVPLSGPLPDLAFEADGHIIRHFASTRLTGAEVDPRFSKPSV